MTSCSIRRAADLVLMALGTCQCGGLEDSHWHSGLHTHTTHTLQHYHPGRVAAEFIWSSLIARQSNAQVSDFTMVGLVALFVPGSLWIVADPPSLYREHAHRHPPNRSRSHPHLFHTGGWLSVCSSFKKQPPVPNTFCPSFTLTQTERALRTSVNSRGSSVFWYFACMPVFVRYCVLIVANWHRGPLLSC